MERLVGTPGRSEGIDKDLLLAALDDATAALRDGDVTFLVMGGIASAAFGRPRATWDIDLFVRMADAERALDALGAGGFRTEVVCEHGLSKAKRDGVTVDVICRSTPDIMLDDEMLARAVTREY